MLELHPTNKENYPPDWENVLLKSTELPYPANYLRYSNPLAAYLLMKVLLLKGERHA